MQPNPASLSPAELELKSGRLNKGMATGPSFSRVSEQAQLDPSVRAGAHGAVTHESRGTAGSASFQHGNTTWPLCDIKQQLWNSLKGWRNVPGLTQNLERITQPECSQRNKLTTEESGAF